MLSVVCHGTLCSGCTGHFVCNSKELLIDQHLSEQHTLDMFYNTPDTRVKSRDSESREQSCQSKSAVQMTWLWASFNVGSVSARYRALTEKRLNILVLLNRRLFYTFYIYILAGKNNLSHQVLYESHVGLHNHSYVYRTKIRMRLLSTNLQCCGHITEAMY